MSSAETTGGDATSDEHQNKLVRTYKLIQPITRQREMISTFSLPITVPLSHNTPWLSPAVKPLIVVFMARTLGALDFILKSWIPNCSLSDALSGCDVLVSKERPVKHVYTCWFSQTSENSDWMNYGVRFLPPRVFKDIIVCTEVFGDVFSTTTNVMFATWQCLLISTTMPDSMHMFIDQSHRWRTKTFSRAGNRYCVQMADYSGKPCRCTLLECKGDPCQSRTSFGFVPQEIERTPIECRLNTLLDSLQLGLRAYSILEAIKITLLLDPGPVVREREPS